MDITVLLAVILVGIVTTAAVESRMGRLDRRIRHLERKLDLLLEHWQVRDDDPRLAEVTALMRQGQDIAAIRKYRTITGADLLEAKQAVDRMNRGPGEAQ
ncbi:hypothetical protein [Streptomyces sp. NPDC017448]|uniref:hypothetical protein n=1 Tax=Streptomyces sp. NPDC017448 TaxID=3364996 RepID=UPI00378D0BC1